MKMDKMHLGAIFITALAMRVLFSFYFQQFYFGDFVFKYGDTSTYLNPIINLINNGEYIHDYFLGDSRYFRVPVYPLFLGFLYLISPEYIFDYVVAGVQCILGSVSAVMVYCIVLNIGRMKVGALFSGLIYAAYPFAILWTPIMYTETLQLFLMLALIYLISNKKFNQLSMIAQGCLIALIILTKQYLGLLIIIPLYVILLASHFTLRQKMGWVLILMLGFTLTLSPWVIRNYISSGKVIVFFGESSGLRNALEDMVAFTQFANKFDENVTEAVVSAAHTGVAKFSRHPQFLAKHKENIEYATMLAYQCGGSFQEWRNHTLADQPPHQNCNHEVASEFKKLSKLFWQEVPFWEATETRRDSLLKIVSKSDLANKDFNFNKNYLMKYILFKYRVVLLLLGFSGMLYLLISKSIDRERRVLVGSLLITALTFYSFFCLVLVQAEMRYLLTPDVLISMFAGVIPAVLLRSGSNFLFKNKRVH